MSNELVPSESAALAVRQEQDSPPSMIEMLRVAIDRGVTGDNANAVEKLAEICDRWEDKRAEREFNVAFSEMQSELPRIIPMKPVMLKDGTIKYRFAPMEHIMEQVQPLLTKHGFSVSFTTPFVAGRIVAHCNLMHRGGHSRQTEFSVQGGHGPPGSSAAQADGSCATYAKRFALCGALNIVIDHDDDARMVGSAISLDQAADLRRRVTATRSDTKKFLAFAEADSFEEIQTGRYAELDAYLMRKEGRL